MIMFFSEVVRAELLADVQRKGEQMAVKLDKVENAASNRKYSLDFFVNR